MKITYRLNRANARCVPIGGASCVLENGNLEIAFEGYFANTEYNLVISTRERPLGRFRVANGAVSIPQTRLKSGIINAELFEVAADGTVQKFIIRPIVIQSINETARGLVAYPEIDDVLKRVADLESKVEELAKQNAAYVEKIAELTELAARLGKEVESGQKTVTEQIDDLYKRVDDPLQIN